MTMVTEPIARYGEVPAAVMEAMHASDVAIWVWPVFITFTPTHRGLGRKREESGTQLHEARMKPYHIYFEGNGGLLARDYAKFPNKVLWKLAEKVREVVAAGKVVHIVDDLGTDLTATYDGNRLYGMQFRAGDPPGRCHFPWGRCGVFNGEGNSNGEVYLSCVQGVAGRLAEPMRWKVKDNIITEVDGGGEVGEECKRLFQRSPRVQSFDRDHVRLSSESFGGPWYRRSDALGADKQNALGRPGHAAQSIRSFAIWTVRCSTASFTSTTGWWSTNTACSIARCCTIPRCSKSPPSLAIRITCSRRCPTKRMARTRRGDSLVLVALIGHGITEIDRREAAEIAGERRNLSCLGVLGVSRGEFPTIRNTVCSHIPGR